VSGGTTEGQGAGNTYGSLHVQIMPQKGTFFIVYIKKINGREYLFVILKIGFIMQISQTIHRMAMKALSHMSMLTLDHARTRLGCM
jgi:hypothetical protein